MATKARKKQAARPKPVAKKKKAPARAAKKPVKAAKAAPSKAAPAAAKATAAAFSAFKERDRYYGKAFGAGQKAKLFLTDGKAAGTADAGRQDLCIAQFAPGPGRITWIYATHGLAACTVAGMRGASGHELVLNWKHADSPIPIKILTQAVKQLCAEGGIQADGILSGDKPSKFGTSALPHWMLCNPEKLTPEKIGETRCPVKFLLLLGITDAEYQVALKVKPEIADGRLVLAEALRAGGIYPVSDPNRTCMTRRGDFNRLWENAFRVVRERAAAHKKPLLK